MVTKRQLRQALERERRTIARRLEQAVAPNLGGPVLGRANISYELAERTKAVGRGGTFTADADGILSLRINDGDSCLGDNAGSIQVTVDNVASVAG